MAITQRFQRPDGAFVFTGVHFSDIITCSQMYFLHFISFWRHFRCNLCSKPLFPKHHFQHQPLHKSAAGIHASMGCYHTLPEGFSDILMFRTLPYSSLERSVAPLGLYRVLHSKECANVTLYIRRSYRSEITNIWRSFLSHGGQYLLKFYTQFTKYLFISFIDWPKSWHFILQKCLLCLIWRVDLKHNICKQNIRTICL